MASIDGVPVLRLKWRGRELFCRRYKDFLEVGLR